MRPGDRGPGVVVDAELGPGDVTALDADSVIAVATASGAPLSHASILIRSLGVPAVTGLGPQILAVPAGTLVLVDGDAGTVQVEPSASALDAVRAEQLAANERLEDARRHAAEPAMTRDGYVIPVVANVGSAGDARSAVRNGADGVGMLRTEFAFLNRSDAPGEEEQYLAYRDVAEAVGERPLVVRTLDLGADVPAWDPKPEPNPALGNRGIRLTLARRDLLATQLRAVARLARDRPIQLMFPMITTVDELREARACFDEVSDGVEVEFGITVEVPAAAITAAVFAPVVDFFAIGTNDLTQYTLAADRANAAVASLADGLHPAVLRMIGEVTKAAAVHERPVCVVGELGTDRLGVPLLLGLGVTSLSVRPNAVAQVKQLVRSVRLDEARALAQAALGAESATAVRRLASSA
ncbi:MAG: putative PEP-binding protein [Acidimicrobiales bacterium]